MFFNDFIRYIFKYIDDLLVFLYLPHLTHVHNNPTGLSIYMVVLQIKEISLKIAVKVAEEAYKDGMASVFPEPEVFDPVTHSRIRIRLFSKNPDLEHAKI